jgi:hypothetical protein
VPGPSPSHAREMKTSKRPAIAPSESLYSRIKPLHALNRLANDRIDRLATGYRSVILNRKYVVSSTGSTTNENTGFRTGKIFISLHGALSKSSLDPHFSSGNFHPSVYKRTSAGTGRRRGSTRRRWSLSRVNGKISTRTHGCKVVGFLLLPARSQAKIEKL